MADRIDISVGIQIARYRKIQGLTQTELAKSLGLTFQQLQKYESGMNRISAARLFKIANRLGITVEELFTQAANDGEKEVYKREVLELTRSWVGIDKEMRSDFLTFVKSLADHSKRHTDQVN